MQRNRGTRFLPLFLTLIIVIVVIVGVVAIGRAILFGGSDSEPVDVATDTSQSTLLATDVDKSVRLTVRGPIVAEENFTSYTIEISPSGRTMNVYNGYLESVRDRKNYDNNTQAYSQLVNALDKAEMMDSDAVAEDDDLLGVCATGYIYEYATVSSGEVSKRLWTSTCDGSKGTFQANVEQVNNLFQKQIPDYNDLTPFETSPFQGLRF